MPRVKNTLRTPFASAVLGGLIVGLIGWLAIAAGWIEAEGEEGSDAPAPLVTTPASDENGGRGGLAINEIYERASTGVAFVEAAAPGPNPQLPFGAPAPQQRASGSGFVIDEGGHIITNAHVVDGAREIEVTLGDEQTYEAELVGQDNSTDIAVLKIDADAELEPLALGDSSSVEVGDPVVAIGNPYGLDRTVTAGIVSALQREITAPDGFTISNVIQTDAPINPGNSGGPLLGASGEVIGVNSQIESSTGGNVGIGFAVPISTASEIAQDLIDDGEVSHAFLGITGADLDAETAGLLNLEIDSGVLVQAVQSGSPAAEAGIEPGDAIVNADGQRIRVGGDIITAVDGEPVSGMDDVIAEIDGHHPGDEIELTLLRGGGERTETVELAERPTTAGR